MPINPPQTVVRTSHALTIVYNGVTIGLINGWAPKTARTITPIYEINTATSGSIYEKVPGNETGNTIEVSRYDLYKSRIETLFGTVDLANSLTNQDAPFTVIERWVAPATPIAGGGTEILSYSGCWFSSIGRAYRSDGDRIVMVSATLEYVKKTVVQSIQQ